MEKKVGVEKNIATIGFKRGSPLDIYELSITSVMKLHLQGAAHPSLSLLSLNSSKLSSFTMKGMKRQGGSS